MLHTYRCRTHPGITATVDTDLRHIAVRCTGQPPNACHIGRVAYLCLGDPGTEPQPDAPCGQHGARAPKARGCEICREGA